MSGYAFLLYHPKHGWNMACYGCFVVYKNQYFRKLGWLPGTSARILVPGHDWQSHLLTVMRENSSAWPPQVFRIGTISGSSCTTEKNCPSVIAMVSIFVGLFILVSRASRRPMKISLRRSPRYILGIYIICATKGRPSHSPEASFLTAPGVSWSRLSSV